jgi:putative tryptophan/tyrosine transport system substrate-binding protein
MASHIGRRKFLATLGGAAVAWPLVVRAQQPAMPVIGYLDAGAPETSARLAAAFRKGLAETGYTESRNVAIEYRWARNEYDRLSEMASDLVRRQVIVIAAMGGSPTALAAKAATTTIPIVFGFGGDPVQTGLVASLNRPGGNITGVVTMNLELAAKRLGLLHELVPEATRFAVLINANNSAAASLTRDALAATAPARWQIEFLAVSTNRDLSAAFASLAQKRADALMVTPELLFVSRRVQLLTLAARYAVPTIYPSREFTEAGGLMSYGSSFTDMYRQAGIYTGRILKGEKPADLPVMQPTTFELVINLQTAQALGIDVPPTLLARADEVIE